MPTEILMPALSPTMEDGKLTKWLVKEGQKVRSGDFIAEIETDKATMEVEAVDEGTVAALMIAEGTEKVRVNTPIAVLFGESEAALAPAVVSAIPQPPASVPKRPAPASSASAAAAAAATLAVKPAVKGSRRTTRICASPLAQRLAKEAGVDLTCIAGTGPRGRIVRRDIEAAAKRAATQAAPTRTQDTALTTTLAAEPAITAPLADSKILALFEKGSYEVMPHDGMRRVIAKRLTQSKQTIPHFYLSLDCRLDALIAARERLNAAAPKDGPRAYKLSVNDFVVKALALALQQVPAANATWSAGGMLRHRHSDVGVAVAVEGGLFTPVIRKAQLKTLSEVSNEMKDLAERARKHRLAPHEYQGGTTSISNLGMYGIKNFDAIINPPHATILAVGSGEKRAAVIGDRIEVATIMSCTLSCDHRVVDGATGAKLLNTLRILIEDPVRMLV